MAIRLVKHTGGRSVGTFSRQVIRDRMKNT